MGELKTKIKDSIIIIFVIVISIIIFVAHNKLSGINKWGYLGVFLLCFLSNLTVLLPAPSLMVVVSYSQVLLPVLVAFTGAAGTTLGELSGYFFGNSASNLSEKAKKCVHKLGSIIKNAELLVFVFAILPLPFFDIAGLFAGGKKMPMYKFLLWCYLGKFLKMLFYATFVAGYADRLVQP